MAILAITSAKGGVGKTASSASLAAGLARSRDVVAIDADKRGDLTFNYGIRGADARHDDGRALAEALLTGGPLPLVGTRWVEAYEGAHIAFERARLRLTAGGGALREVYDALVVGRVRPEQLFARVLDLDADVVVIDCPPGDERVQEAAFAVADHVIVPVRSDLNALRGLADVAKVIAKARDHNPKLNFAGVLMYDFPAAASAKRREARATIEAVLQGAAGVFSAVIRSSTEYAMAEEVGLVPAEFHEYTRLTRGAAAARPVAQLALDFDAFMNEVVKQCL